MAEEGKSGKRVVAVLLGLVLAAAVIAWVGATQLENGTRAGQPRGDELAAAVLSEGVVYEARSGDPDIVVAKDVGPGKELSRAELRAVTSQHVLSVNEDFVDVQIAGTPWMTLHRSTGEPVE